MIKTAYRKIRDKKKISIITIVKDDESGILKTIKSVNEQNINKSLIEHIIVYTKSKDKTLKNIYKHKSNFRKLIYQKKRGIYEAINLGIKKSSGKYVIILHSGDIYYKNYILHNFYNKFVKKNYEIVFSSIAIVDFKKKKIFRHYKIRKISNFLLRCGWMPPHEGMMIQKKIIEKYNFYNPKFRIASDFDFLVRVLFMKNFKKLGYYKNISVLMNNEGVSSKLRNKFQIFREISSILKKNKIFALRIFQIFRYILRIEEILFNQKIKL
jgi:glycosyltransferase involved in cell wall biosynthesis